MVKIADTKIKNIGFNTSVETGTKVESGDGLAKLVATTIGAKRSLEQEQNKVEQAETKESNLIFNDLKIDAQRRQNEYDFADRNNPTSSELMDLYEQTIDGQKDLYGMLAEEHRQKYDLYYAGKDGEVNNLIHKEAKVGASTYTEASVQNFRTEEAIDNWVESMDGLVNKKEIFEIAAKKAESFLETGALDNMTSEQLGAAFPYMDFIKDPAIGTKFKEHVVKLKEKEGIAAMSNSGLNKEAIAAKTGKSIKDIEKEQKLLVNDLWAKGDTENAIKMSNHNGIRITELDRTPETLKGTIQSNPAAAVDIYKNWLNTRETYNYEDKTVKAMEEYRIVSTLHGLDLTTEDGMQQAAHYIDEANRPDAPKITIPTDKELLDVLDPIGFNTKSNYGENEFAYIAPRTRELLKFTGGDVASALEIAKEEFDSFDGDGWFDDRPFAMFAKDSDEVNLALEQYSNKANADGVEIKYLGTDKWALTTIDDDGNENTVFKTNAQMKAAIVERKKFKDGLKTLSAVISTKGIDDSLKGKQIKADAKEIKTIIDTKAKELEKQMGEKLNSIQKEQLSKVVVNGLKDRMHEEDLKEKGGIAYNEETKTVTFSFGNFIEDVFYTVMGKEVPNREDQAEIVKGEEIMKNGSKPAKDELDNNMVYTANNEEIMGSILESELGINEFVEGKLHAGQETITKSNPNGELNTTNYGVVVTDFPKKEGETDLAHAKRYYDKKVKPALAKVKGIETASSDVIIGLSKLVWNKGNIIKKLDLTNPEKTVETLLDVTTTKGKHSNGVINRTIGDYSLIAEELKLPEISYVRTTEPKNGRYRIQYLDANMKIIHDDARMASSANGSRIKGGKTYNVVNNNIAI